MRLGRPDVAALSAIVLVFLAWGGLLLLHPDRFCYSDCAVEMLPRLIAIARSFQSGALAFWDVHTLGGAKPFWMSTSSIYYPVLFPLYWLTDVDDVRQAAILLQVLPYVLHVASAAMGGYILARVVMHLNAAGALVVGLAFAFSPPILTTMYFVNQAQGYSFLPWITLVALRVLDTGSRRLWGLGAVLIGAMSFASNPDVVSRVLVLVGLQVGGYWILSHWRTAWSWRNLELTRLLSLLPMVIVGLGTFTFGFAGIFQGISLALTSLALTCDQVAGFAEYSSLRPSSLLTLFYPSMFVSIWELGNVGAGALLLSAASFAVIAGRRAESATGRWTVIGAAAAGLGILVSTGNHTPVFGWLCAAFPLVFGFPHPVNYTVAVSWGVAILAGVGVSGLTTHPPSRGTLVLCSWPVAAAAFITLLRPEISSFEWQTRIASVPGYVLVTALILLSSLGLARHLRAPAIWTAVVLELLISPFYLAMNLPSGESKEWMDHTKWTLSNSPIAELEPILRRIVGSGEVRFVGTRGLIDNQAWVVNGRALLGMGPKPIFRSFGRACSAFVLNLPYEHWLIKLPQFMSNMNVGYLVADRMQGYKLLNPPEDLERLFADFAASVASLPVVDRTERFDVRALPKPLPYAYIQDRVYIADADEQFRRLIETDLRQAAYVSPEAGAGRSGVVGSFFQEQDASAADRFEQVRKANPVKVDGSNPNAKVIELEVRQPALLVIAETWHPGWHARINGKEAPVWEVNFLQQGVWVDPGTHVVELYFRPTELVYAAIASIVSLLIIIAVAISGWWAQTDAGGHPAH